MIEFADDTARINALNSGQIQAMSQLPKSQAKVIEATEGLALLNAETGAWRPFTMRIDAKPFNDVRVRQAFRLIVDRQQMIDQAYSGLGVVANDMYGRYDAGTPDLPQRVQDIEQAKSLLKQAGYDNNLTVELVTSAEGARAATRSRRRRCSPSRPRRPASPSTSRRPTRRTFYGKDYLSWPFAQDFWATRGFLQQASQGTMAKAPYNETHWKNAEWPSLVDQAWKTVDDDRARRAHHPGAADRVRRGRLHHLVVAQPGRRLLQDDHRLQAGQARRSDRPDVLQGRLLRVS